MRSFVRISCAALAVQVGLVSSIFPGTTWGAGSERRNKQKTAAPSGFPKESDIDLLLGTLKAIKNWEDVPTVLKLSDNDTRYFQNARTLAKLNGAFPKVAISGPGLMVGEDKITLFFPTPGMPAVSLSWRGHQMTIPRSLTFQEAVEFVRKFDESARPAKPKSAASYILQSAIPEAHAAVPLAIWFGGTAALVAVSWAANSLVPRLETSSIDQQAADLKLKDSLFSVDCSSSNRGEVEAHIGQGEPSAEVEAANQENCRVSQNAELEPYLAVRREIARRRSLLDQQYRSRQIDVEKYNTELRALTADEDQARAKEKAELPLSVSLDNHTGIASEECKITAQRDAFATASSFALLKLRVEKQRNETRVSTHSDLFPTPVADTNQLTSPSDATHKRTLLAMGSTLREYCDNRPAVKARLDKYMRDNASKYAAARARLARQLQAGNPATPPAAPALRDSKR